MPLHGSCGAEYAADPLLWPDTHLLRNVTVHWTATTVSGPLVGYGFVECHKGADQGEP